MLESRPLRTSMIVVAALLVTTGCASMRGAGTQNRDRVIVIAGASSGFGKGVALRLAEQGSRLVLAARRVELLEELARECAQRGGDAIAVKTDVSREEDVGVLARTTLERFARIDVWINMAGVGAAGRFDEIPLPDHLRVIDVNVNGVINGSHHAMRVFRRQGYGTLINMASMTGRIALPYYASYSASKHAVVGLGIALHQELRLNGDRNIRVSTILPYASDTPWWQHAANYSGHELTMPAMDPPEKIVEAVVNATVAPKPEVVVGYKAKAFATSHRFLRRATEDIGGTVTHDSLTDAEPAASTRGNLHEPIREGAGVRGGDAPQGSKLLCVPGTAGADHPAVKRLRTICLSLPETSEKLSHGEPTWWVRKKMFATLDDHHHGADRLAVWLAAPLLTQELLVKRDPRRFFVPPYVGSRGWIGLRIDGRPSWRLVETLVRDAYAHVAPPSLSRVVDGSKPGR